MAVSSRKSSGPVIRSLSPCTRLHSSYSPATSFSSSGFASSSASLTSRSATLFHRPSSPTPRVEVYGSKPSASSVRFSLDRPGSPSRSITVSARTGASHKNQLVKTQSHSKRTCMCSPTTHPGSFRCNLHKGLGSSSHSAAPYSSNRLHARRSAMTNSLVRIGGVEGEWVKRALSALIRPSSHNLRRRSEFQPRPSRLSVMSMYGDS